MALFMDLYRRRCRYPIGWFEVGEVALIGPKMLHEAVEKLRLITKRLKQLKDEKKSFVYVTKRDFELDVNSLIYLKKFTLEWFNDIWEKGKISPSYVGPY